MSNILSRAIRRSGIYCWIYGHDIAYGETVYGPNGGIDKFISRSCTACLHDATETDLDWPGIMYIIKYRALWDYISYAIRSWTDWSIK